MKKQTFTEVAAAALVLMTGFIYWRMQPVSQPNTESPSERQSGAASRPITSRPSSAAVPTSAVAVLPTPAKAVNIPVSRVEKLSSRSGDQPTRVVRIPAEAVLATVNGSTITLQDLLPLGKSQAITEQVMSPGMFSYLLNRAIERELAFQAARAKGIELTAEQKEQQHQVAQTMLERNGDRPGKVVHLNRMATLEEEIKFEMRDAASQLLVNSLLADAGAPGPHVTEQSVKDYYQAHRSEFTPAVGSDAVELEKTWQNIDFQIRQELSPVFQADYQEARTTFIEGLKAEAKIKRLAMVESRTPIEKTYKPN